MATFFIFIELQKNICCKKLNLQKNFMPQEFTKWVACFGNATSITDRKESTYAKNLTLRYPIHMCFSGNKLRFHFSNLTGTEDVVLSEACVTSPRNITEITFNGEKKGLIPAGKELLSDEISLDVFAGDLLEISLYFENFTQMNSGTHIKGPLSGGFFTYGNFTHAKELPTQLTRKTNWYFFLNTIDIFTEEKNHALICFGDSITAEDWPDYLTLRCKQEGYNNISIIRKAVSGTRILREYNCITYAAYGLKGSTRFPIEMNVAGARGVIIQHGINDIIHPVGIENNPFRPWSDMPTAMDLQMGVRDIYVKHARSLNLKVYSGTLLPFFGWRTYNENRDSIRNTFNEWLRTAPEFDNCIDFDKAVRNENEPLKFAEGFDSGDHLHPSSKAYKAMANCVPAELLK